MAASIVLIYIEQNLKTDANVFLVFFSVIVFENFIWAMF